MTAFLRSRIVPRLQRRVVLKVEESFVQVIVFLPLGRGLPLLVVGDLLQCVINCKDRRRLFSGEQTVTGKRNQVVDNGRRLDVCQRELERRYE